MHDILQFHTTSDADMSRVILDSNWRPNSAALLGLLHGLPELKTIINQESTKGMITKVLYRQRLYYCAISFDEGA
jgi:hypothetical protein